MLIDIQQKIQEGKGEAYEQWARIYNIKQAAKTLIYLKENGINSYDVLIKKAAESKSDFNGKQSRIKEIEARQKEIAELQKQIGTYSKTRDIYAKYRASKWNRDFYDIHASDIILHRAAKKHFDELGLKKLPSINSLKQEWSALEAEKKTLYRGYRERKDRYVDLQMARDNVQRLFGIDRDAPEQSAERQHSRRDIGAR